MNDFTPNHITDDVTKRDLWISLETGRAPYVVIHEVYQYEHHIILLSADAALALLADLQRALAVIAPETEISWHTTKECRCVDCEAERARYAYAEKLPPTPPPAPAPYPPETDEPPFDEDTQPLHIPEKPGAMRASISA